MARVAHEISQLHDTWAALSLPWSLLLQLSVGGSPWFCAVYSDNSRAWLTWDKGCGASRHPQLPSVSCSFIHPAVLSDWVYPAFEGSLTWWQTLQGVLPLGSCPFLPCKVLAAWHHFVWPEVYWVLWWLRHPLTGSLLTSRPYVKWDMVASFTNTLRVPFQSSCL